VFYSKTDTNLLNGLFLLARYQLLYNLEAKFSQATLIPYQDKVSNPTYTISRLKSRPEVRIAISHIKRK